MPVASIPLDIFSDPVCPWCYIGKTNLYRAMESRPDHPFHIEWHPYQLHPNLPAHGMNRAEWFEARFGDQEKAVEIAAAAQKAADEAGLDVDMGAAQRMPNTIEAHRLIHWAGLQGVQTPVVDALFRAYFRDGQDIGDHAVLIRIAGAAGMDPDAAARLLATDADRDDLIARDRDARSKGVQAVPTFLIDRQYVLAGAQSVEMWQKIIDDITTELGEAE
ncbi:DsbA family protein [Falsirhodobacter sp. alg1]|uniref:DsbA family oxidoreductase n=1 Tax=Falsirhodobacter sp. alg1 TaxID=1472418 RepID=UPI0005EDC53F|nr:DsbA family oxidoreductase [Falsirhodobacter sp. alg1]